MSSVSYIAASYLLPTDCIYTSFSYCVPLGVIDMRHISYCACVSFLTYPLLSGWMGGFSHIAYTLTISLCYSYSAAAKEMSFPRDYCPGREQ